ncbi:LysM peptidoglycan-binding domain-containing protein [Rhodococcus sp. D2-41]|uniref:LysM peptidoglycan-binding domain-containing protein n=1 Tax=Speluncibacter jeojiensis TaxID=2710754 RepID=A0A9X4M685_9ACTN|nr:LysM peptidoglycan-binding domain-containing protein [Rhodococcus sp. D2-41]MDG3011443.1 LysM peptidoglycan-binding domain-containing protein [Rhodococcus sp. D2-41]MDG3016722.1 LysM peptidoglycan-binding domain-containing protein [Corynebacteriales bacterium D3-21]
MDAYTVFPNRMGEPVFRAGNGVDGHGGSVGGGCRPAADRRRVASDGCRPGGMPMCYPSAGVRFSRERHRPVADSGGVGVVLLTALITVATVLALVGLAHVRAGDTGSNLPTSVGVVQVRSGEGLGELAHRVAPGAGTGVMVERIKELNGLADSTVRQGQQLLVPMAQVR